MMGEGDQGLFEYADRTDHGPYAALNFSFFGGIFKAGVTAVLPHPQGNFWRNQRRSGCEHSQFCLLGRRGPAIHWRGEAHTSLYGTAHLCRQIKQHIPQGLQGQKRGSRCPGRSARHFGCRRVSSLPKLAKPPALHFEIDYKDLTRRHTLRSGRRLNLGAELDFKRSFFRARRILRRLRLGGNRRAHAPTGI